MRRIPLIFGFFLLAIPAWTQTFVNAGGAVSGGSTASFTLSVTAGNTVAVCGATNSLSNTITVTDTDNDTFTAAGASFTDSGNNAEIQLFTARFGTTNASESITVHFTSTVNWQMGVGVQFSGMATSPLDQGPANASNSAVTSWVSGTTGTTSQANEAIIACFSTPTGGITWTGTNGYTVPSGGSAGNGSVTSAMEYKTVTSTGAFQATATASSSTSGPGGVITLKASGGGAAPAGVNKRIKIENLDPISYSIDPAAISDFPGCDVADAACTMEIEVCDDRTPPNCLHVPADGVPHLMQAFFIARQTIPAVQAVTSAVTAKASSVVVTAVQ